VRVPFPRAQQLCGLTLLLTSLGCIEGFHTPSAYDSQRYLCAPEQLNAFTDVVKTCRAQSQPCAGVLSMKGFMEDRPITVESVLDSTQFDLVGSTLSSVEADGRSPYFEFTFNPQSIGGRVDQVSTTQRILLEDRGATTRPNDLDDGFVNVAFRLAGGAVIRNLEFLDDGTGYLSLSLQSAGELKGRFHGRLSPTADVLEGCFDLFPTHVVLGSQ
jgi:hypothetical protein